MATFQGSQQDDNFYGTEEDDLFLMGGGGGDTVSGNGGDDLFNFGRTLDNFDVIDGGSGYDTIMVQGGPVERTILLDNIAGIESIRLHGHKSFGFDLSGAGIHGGGEFTFDARGLIDGARVIQSATSITDAHLKILGSPGWDVLSGGALDDVIYGGGGEDVMFGDDHETGGNGADLFLYKHVSDSTPSEPDFVHWDPLAGDRIDLRRIDADTAAPGNQAFSFIGTAAFSGAAGELRYEALSGGGGFYILGDVDGDGTADLAIQSFADHQPSPVILTASEFVL